MTTFFGEFSSSEYWTPKYGGIDWGLRRGALIEQEVIEEYIPVAIKTGDGLIEEINQENSAFYLNRVDPDMDMLAVADPRDGLEWVWFRDENEDNFGELVKTLGRSALIHTSEYPLETVVESYLRRKQGDIDSEQF